MCWETPIFVLRHSFYKVWLIAFCKAVFREEQWGMKASAEHENWNWRKNVDDGFFVQPFAKFDMALLYVTDVKFYSLKVSSVLR